MRSRLLFAYVTTIEGHARDQPTSPALFPYQLLDRLPEYEILKSSVLRLATYHQSLENEITRQNMHNLLSTVLFPAAAASVAHAVTGIITYGPLFGATWKSALKKEKNNLTWGEGPVNTSEVNKAFALNFATNIVKASIHISLLRVLTGSKTWASFVVIRQPRSLVGVATASAILWLGLQVPVHVEQLLWEDRLPILNIVAAGRQLVDMIISGAVFYFMGAI
ncbi:hypothetical protein DFJ77DRAFT_510558 [Powellomyces hirtus]|nr:hypothetical protein DFJ77DRAFT_510558 [Powellomyces hirtus]